MQKKYSFAWVIPPKEGPARRFQYDVSTDSSRAPYFRLGYVLSAIVIITLLLYPWLAASVRLRYRYGQRLVPKVYHRILRALLGIQTSIQGIPCTSALLVVANHGGQSNYEHACRIIGRMRMLREGLGETKQHAAYLGDLMSRHKAKRNFMKLLTAGDA